MTITPTITKVNLTLTTEEISALAFTITILEDLVAFNSDVNIKNITLTKSELQLLSDKIFEIYENVD